MSADGTTSGVLTFDLGGEFQIVAIGIWNISGNSGIRGFEVFADNDANFDNGGRTLLGQGNFSSVNLSFNRSSILRRYLTEARLNTQYVHLNILSNHGGNAVGLGEVVFAEIPFEFSNLPAMVFLVAVGGLAYFQNLKKGVKSTLRFNPFRHQDIAQK